MLLLPKFIEEKDPFNLCSHYIKSYFFRTREIIVRRLGLIQVTTNTLINSYCITMDRKDTDSFIFSELCLMGAVKISHFVKGK